MILNLEPKKVSGGFPSRKPLNDLSWSEISQISQSGRASQYWKVGDTKTLNIGAVPYEVVILGFDLDTLADGSGTAGITFGLKQCLNERYVMSRQLEDVTDGWLNSALRTLLNGTIYNQLDSGLRPLIREVSKLCSDGLGIEVYGVADKLFLPSGYEIAGDDNGGWFDGEGTAQYPYFADPANRIKTIGGVVSAWWTRSPAYWDETCFCVVTAAGGTWRTETEMATQQGVSFAFCV